MKTIAETRILKLKELVAEYGSAKALAERISKDPSQLSQWMNASKDSKTGKPRGMSSDIARYIETSCEKPSGWLDTPTASRTERPADSLEVAGMIPVISWVNAGSWEDPVDNYHVGDAEIWLPCPPNCNKESTFGLKITGDSMDDGSSGGYRDGEIVFVDGSQVEPVHNSDIVVKNESGKVTFKRLINSGGAWYLKPLNPNWPEKIIDLGERSTIVGRVMFSGRHR